jgi:hypothetical protein
VARSGSFNTSRFAIVTTAPPRELLQRAATPSAQARIIRDAMELRPGKSSLPAKQGLSDVAGQVNPYVVPDTLTYEL